MLTLLLACSSTPTPPPTRTFGPPPVAAWIPPQCYAVSTAEAPRNPCSACHQRGRRPHTLDDSDLQAVYDFPEPARFNHYDNLFVDRTQAVAGITDAAIDAWVRTANTPKPTDAWGAHFDLDADGFDRTPEGVWTGWRAYRSTPFPGFFPTNGNWGDALLRLPATLRPDEATAILNLAILDAVLGRADQPIPPTDEKSIGVDLDLDGALTTATQITYRFSPTEHPMRWVGDHPTRPTPGLFPEGTEILHSVRYLDPGDPVKMAARMKELRHMEKTRWLTYADLASGTAGEESERTSFPDRLEPVLGNFSDGVSNGSGWRLRARIEDAEGSLRPQTTAELGYCIGCHGGVGVTTDSVFSYVRKTDWGHGHTMPALADPARRDGQGEYATWLAASGAVDDFGTVAVEPFDATDLRPVVLPDATRARALNKAYRLIVAEQSFLHGRDAVWGLDETQAFREVPPLHPTGNRTIVRPAWMR